MMEGQWPAINYPARELGPDCPGRGRRRPATGGDGLAVSDSTAERYRLQDPDVRLMLRVKDDDALAFEQLVARYEARLLTVMRHLVGRHSQAEDLVQEVFLRVYRARKRYEPGSKFSTWVYTIANNVARNALRTLARRHEVHVAPRPNESQEGAAIEQMAQAASGLMPTRQLEGMERADVVRQAIDALNERQRMALLLAKFEGMSYADIGETMGMSEKAVKSLISRARENLRVILAPYMRDGDSPRSKDR